MGGDPGLFGPESVTWRLHADPTLVVGGIRALLLQALHPRAMAGVAQHSGFRSDPWGRLQRTADYIGATTYGTKQEATRAAGRVRRVHRHLVGTDPDTGSDFRIDDPDLLLWVHCCEVDSLLATVRRAGAPIGAADADRYVAEQVRAAELVGLPAESVPRTAKELARYFEEMRPRLRASEEARAAARFVLFPPMPLWVQIGTPARPLWIGLALLAFGLLPDWARRMYGIPTPPLTGLAATVALRGTRAALLAIPAQVREGPALKRARARLA